MENELMEYDKGEVVAGSKDRKSSMTPEQKMAIAKDVADAAASVVGKAMEYDAKVQAEAMRETVEAQKNVLDYYERKQQNLLQDDLQEKEKLYKEITNPDISPEEKALAYKRLDEIDARLERKYMSDNEKLIDTFREARQQTQSKGFFGQLLAWFRW